MIKKKDIIDAQNKIRSLIEIQVKDGVQSQVVKLVEPDAYSLGQFLSDKERNQRGVHGTAAGLRVLAATSQKSLVVGLVSYLEKRLAIERQISSVSTTINDASLIRDDNNVIKLSETLYSLSFVTPAHMATDQYKQALGNKLINSKNTKDGNTGWDWYLDVQDFNFNTLPSAFAILALHKNGYDCSDVRSSLLDVLEKEDIKDPATLAVTVFSLFALLRTSRDNNEDKRLYAILKKIWKSPHCSLLHDYEQNLEYWYNSQHEYARIPWQIFLIAITSKISKRRFLTVNLQRRLTSLVINAKSTGFSYPFSGPKLSSRTNALLYDALDQVKEDLTSNFYYTLMIGLDKSLRFLFSRTIKIIAGIIGASGILFSVIGYFFYDFPWLKDFAIGFVSSMFLSFITFAKKK